MHIKVLTYSEHAVKALILRMLLPVLMEYAEELLVFGGDLNFAMNSLLDESPCSSHLKHLKVDLHRLHQIDPWQLWHPQERDYSFSQVHHTDVLTIS